MRSLMFSAALASLGACLASPASAASPQEGALQRVFVHTTPAPDDHGVVVQVVSVVAAPAPSVVQALDDITALPAWLPRMKAVTRVEAPVDAAPAAPRFQSVLGLPWPVGEVRETMSVRREVEGEVVRLRWDHVEGDMRRNDILWTVTPLDAEHTEVRYDASLWFRSWIPVFLIRLAESKYAPWFVDCLERRAAALATAAAPPTNAAAVEAAPKL